MFLANVPIQYGSFKIRCRFMAVSTLYRIISICNKHDHKFALSGVKALKINDCFWQLV